MPIKSMVKDAYLSIRLKFSKDQMERLQTRWRKSKGGKPFEEWLSDWVGLLVDVAHVRSKKTRVCVGAGKTVGDLKIGVVFSNAKERAAARKKQLALNRKTTQSFRDRLDPC
jgi:hypothetical protein